jgi:HrpA-like RNA helicase
LIRESDNIALGRLLLELPPELQNMCLFMHDLALEPTNREQLKRDQGNIWKRFDDFLSKNMQHSKSLIQRAKQLHISSLPNAKQRFKITQVLCRFLPKRIAYARAQGGFENHLFQISADDIEHSANAILLWNVFESRSNHSHKRAGQRFWSWLPIPENILDLKLESRITAAWKTKGKRIVVIREEKQAGIVLNKTEVPLADLQPAEKKLWQEQALKIWHQKKEEQSIAILNTDNTALRTWQKMKWAANYFPEYTFPAWDEDDLELLWEEFFYEASSESDLSEHKLLHILWDLFGESWRSWLEQEFPDTFKLPNGRRAKYRYEDDIIEVEARLSDFLGLWGKHHIGEGRIPVRYHLLTPGYRTIQKTMDLTQFWSGSYAAIRKDLRGRYPKHPWPTPEELKLQKKGD